MRLPGAAPVVRMQVGHHEQLLGNGQCSQARHCPVAWLRKACVLQLSPAQHACACNDAQQMHVTLQSALCIASCLLLHNFAGFFGGAKQIQHPFGHRGLCIYAHQLQALQDWQCGKAW